MSTQKVTKDVYLAAAFLTIPKVELVKVDRSDPRHMKFYFEQVASEGPDDIVDLDKIELQWFNNELTGNFTDFKNALQRMKSVIHSE